MYLKQGELFLMTGKKRPNNKTSNYLVSMGEGDTKRSSKNYLGKPAARANFAQSLGDEAEALPPLPPSSLRQAARQLRRHRLRRTSPHMYIYIYIYIYIVVLRTHTNKPTTRWNKILTARG